MHLVSFQKAVEPNTRAQTSMEPHVACRKARFRVPCQPGGRYVTLATFKVYLTNCTRYKKAGSNPYQERPPTLSRGLNTSPGP